MQRSVSAKEHFVLGEYKGAFLMVLSPNSQRRYSLGPCSTLTLHTAVVLKAAE